MSAVMRSAERLPGRTAVGKGVCVIAFVALAWLFGGAAGLALGVLIVVGRAVFALPARYFWIGALGALAAAPIATIAQGLPDSSVVGPEFGEHHLAAHFLVGASLALAAFAGLLDADRTHWRPARRRPSAATVAGIRARRAGPAGAEEPLDPKRPQADLRPTKITIAARVRAAGRRASALGHAEPGTPAPSADPSEQPAAPPVVLPPTQSTTPPIAPPPKPAKPPKRRPSPAPGFDLPKPAPPQAPADPEPDSSRKDLPEARGSEADGPRDPEPGEAGAASDTSGSMETPAVVDGVTEPAPATDDAERPAESPDATAESGPATPTDGPEEPDGHTGTPGTDEPDAPGSSEGGNEPAQGELIPPAAASPDAPSQTTSGDSSSGTARRGPRHASTRRTRRRPPPARPPGQETGEPPPS